MIVNVGVFRCAVAGTVEEYAGEVLRVTEGDAGTITRVTEGDAGTVNRVVEGA